MCSRCLKILKGEFQRDLSKKYGIKALKYLSVEWTSLPHPKSFLLECLLLRVNDCDHVHFTSPGGGWQGSAVKSIVRALHTWNPSLVSGDLRVISLLQVQAGKSVNTRAVGWFESCSLSLSLGHSSTDCIGFNIGCTSSHLGCHSGRWVRTLFRMPV